jgi:hypothetical protein
VAPAAPADYLRCSRDPAVGLFAVLPLWLAYEVLRFWVAPEDRNGAEDFLLRALEQLPWRGLVLLRSMLGAGLLLAAASLVRRQIPWLRFALLAAAEGSCYGVLMGPLASAMTHQASRVLAAAPGTGRGLAADLVGSLGAGIFEELLFRLGLLSVLAWLWLRVARAWSMPRWTAGIVAVLLSALAFAWFHHLCGEPFERTRFLFRTAAGILLGLLMWFRGFGVCVYTHACYDTYYYLTHPTGP